MNRRTAVSIGVITCVAVIGWWLNSGAATQGPVSPETPTESQVPGGEYAPHDPRWAEVRRKEKLDRNWEWKLPLNFYGRVLDESGQAVVGAQVKLSWTTLNREGGATETTVSDYDGNFRLLDKSGKSLVVRVSKDGYYTPRRQRISFDYSAFWDADYYEPNPESPVLFRLRKMGGGNALSRGESTRSSLRTELRCALIFSTEDESLQTGSWKSPP